MKRRTFFTIILCTQSCFARFNHPNCYFLTPISFNQEITTDNKLCYARTSQFNSQDYKEQASYPIYNGTWVTLHNIVYINIYYNLKTNWTEFGPFMKLIEDVHLDYPTGKVVCMIFILFIWKEYAKDVHF